MAELQIIEPLLWDVNIKEVNIQMHKKFIMERILKLGRPEQVKWMQTKYSNDEIAAVVKHSKNIDRKTANYWAIHLEIPTNEVLCLNRQLMQNCFY